MIQIVSYTHTALKTESKMKSVLRNLFLSICKSHNALFVVMFINVTLACERKFISRTNKIWTLYSINMTLSEILQCLQMHMYSLHNVNCVYICDIKLKIV